MPAPRFILVRSKDSANVGAAARAMKNFGFDDLVLVAPRCRIDARARALASHAGDVLERATVVDSLEAAIGDLRWVLGTSARKRGTESLPLARPRQAAPTLWQAGAGVLFGPEDHGLGNAELALCQGYLSIPTADYASLNLAQAVLLVAYEAHMARPARAADEAAAAAGVEADVGVGAENGAGADAAAWTPRVPGRERAPREQLERFYAQLVEAFHRIGYTDAQRERAILQLYRGVFDRVALTPREVAALRGLVSQVMWAAEQSPERLPERKDER